MFVRVSLPGPVFAMALLALLPPIGSGRGAAAEELPQLNVQLDQTSVSGLSSGAYMAGQFHLAFSDSVIGAGLVAGGPYNCAEGSLAFALSRCMSTVVGTPDAAELFEAASGFAEAGQIDALSNLADDRVYVFSGSEDDTVEPVLGAQTAAFYRLAGVSAANLAHVTEFAAGHGFATEDFGNEDCAVTESPFINDCDYDQAGAILQHIYGPLNPPAANLGGQVVAFDQGDFISNPNAHSMGDTGFLYLPEACAAGQSCRVHIAFHGCRQTSGDIGDLFYTRTGFNGWADTNKLIILYPQAHSGPGNPRSCWDWWGYDGADYALRSGRQMAAVKAMLDRLVGVSPPDDDYCQVYRTSNYTHWLEDRAEICGFWSFCAVGSGDLLGFWFTSTDLYEHPQGNFTITACGS